MSSCTKVPETEKAKFKILFVDDSEDLLEVFQEVLSSEGYTVETATSGNNALGYLQNNTVDLIISDVRMPDGDGLHLAKNLPNPKTDIIFMTGYLDIDPKDFQQTGILDLIKKPTKIETVIAIIESIRRGTHPAMSPKDN